MRIGLIIGLHGSEGSRPPAPTWDSILDGARTAEAVGFDSVVFEDALLYRGSESTEGCWESVAIAGALAAGTSTIEFGQSVVNAPYRSPALLAKIAKTLDEISGGRYIFGLGAGNTPNSDYEAFGFPTDKRYSRFAEAIEIIHPLLKDGKVDFNGEYHSARDAELVLRGPRRQGPPIVIAAAGPKMLRLTARFADGWNWWTADHRDAIETLEPVVDEFERACDAVGRDPATIDRSLDFYTVDPVGLSLEEEPVSIGHPMTGSAAEIADMLLGFGALGFSEVRCDLYPPESLDAMPECIEAMSPVVELVHAA